MMRSNTFQDLAAVPMPDRTASYTPVPHADLVLTINDMLMANDFNIVNHSYELAAEGNQLFGVYHIEAGDGTFRKALGFRNSYDKSIAIGICAGSSVIVCSNLMFKGQTVMMRKHTGNCTTDIYDMVMRSFDVMDVEFEDIKGDAAILRDKPMSRQEMAHHAGQLFINEDLFNSTQLNVMKREIVGSPLFQGETAWDFYNHATEAMKHAAPRERLAQQRQIHRRVMELVS